MRTGELLTRVTIWVALAGYALGAASILLSRQRAQCLKLARWAWSFGCLAFLIHISVAMHFYHNWSHASFYHATERAVERVFGSPWGEGVYVSYAFTWLWALDVIWWWAKGLTSYFQRPPFLRLAWHAFFFFIVFNGTLVFEKGPVRVYGLLICLMLLFLWLAVKRKRLFAAK